MFPPFTFFHYGKYVFVHPVGFCGSLVWRENEKKKGRKRKEKKKREEGKRKETEKGRRGGGEREKKRGRERFFFLCFE